jgi:hypothetical protein
VIKIKVATFNEFKNCRVIWNNLVQSMERPSIFCTWEWIYTWWEIFGRNYKNIIFFIYDDECLIGILPLGIRKMFLEDSIVPVRVLSFLGTYELYPDYMDFIYNGCDSKTYLNSIFDYLVKNFNDWDVIHFSHVSEESHLMRFFSSKTSQMRNDINYVSTAPFISLKSRFEGNFEKYLQSLSRNKRHDLKRRRKILYDRFDINYVHSGATQSGMGIKRLFDLHEMRAKKKRKKSSFQGDKLLSFHEKIADIFEKDGHLFLRYLKANGCAVAALYCFFFAGQLFAYQSGIDPDWENRGVGSALLFEAINEAADGGVSEFDFLRGGEAYKDTWTNETRKLYEIWIYNNTLRSVMFRWTNQIRSKTKRIIKKLIF